MLRFKARKVMDLNAGYDVFDEAHQTIGFFRKDFKASLLRSTFHVEGPGYTGTGRRRGQRVAIGAPVQRHSVPPDPLRLRDPRGPAAAQHRAAGQRSATATPCESRTRASTSASPPPSRSPWTPS